jgi:hypothetical protein
MLELDQEATVSMDDIYQIGLLSVCRLNRERLHLPADTQVRRSSTSAA